mmetsp:Transcript_23921/g.28222  ORF Transcript_23921/g.28222 Transcript_23921/m.28222 type:complete len:167 (+) Transcript_23921:92-592(+)
MLFRIYFRIVAIIAYHASHTTVIATTSRISPNHGRRVDTPPSNDPDTACIADSVALNDRSPQAIEMTESICTTNGGTTYEASLSSACTNVQIDPVVCMDPKCSDTFVKEFLKSNFYKSLGDNRADGCTFTALSVSSETNSAFATRITAGNILVTGSLFLLVIGLLS